MFISIRVSAKDVVSLQHLFLLCRVLLILKGFVQFVEEFFAQDAAQRLVYQPETLCRVDLFRV